MLKHMLNGRQAARKQCPNQPPNQPPNKEKDDAAEKRRVFMQFLTRTLRTKGCPTYVQTARKIYRHMIGIGRQHPSRLSEIIVQIDKLPRGKSAEWYRRNALAIFMDAELAVKEQVRHRTGPRGAGEAVIGRDWLRLSEQEREARVLGKARLATQMKDLLPAAVEGLTPT